MELFESRPTDQPLAARMRPRTLDEFKGQSHILGKGKLLRRSIMADRLTSVIFYGPPGTGKTTLAHIIAGTTKSKFLSLNAVLSGVGEIRSVIAEAKKNKDLYSHRTILFVDEVHRWNKAQQDALLPWVENGTFILIGATTENPYFEVNAALVSRSRIFPLFPLSDQEMKEMALQALRDKERGYGKYKIEFEKDALEHLVKIASGDARNLLNAIELAVETSKTFPLQEDQPIFIPLATAEESIQQRIVLYDKEGDYHFDTISAFIKSVRGSDPDAALYWMAKMLLAGESPHYIFRRLIILASEDVGLANPEALSVVIAAASAFDRVGMPEGQFHLAQAALYLATSEKSNSTMAYFDALAAIKKEGAGEVPNHLKDDNRDKEGLGHGKGYLYPHAFRNHWAAQAYLPETIQGKVFYQPSSQGYEATLRETVLKHRESRLAAMLENDSLSANPQKSQQQWLSRLSETEQSTRTEIRHDIFDFLSIQSDQKILIAFDKSGFFIWEALRKAEQGSLTVLLPQKERETLKNYASLLKDTYAPQFLDQSLSDYAKTKNKTKFDVFLGRNVFMKEKSLEEIAVALKTILNQGAKIAFWEFVPAFNTPLSFFFDLSSLKVQTKEKFLAVEREFYTSLCAITSEESFVHSIEQAGFVHVTFKKIAYQEETLLSPTQLQVWLKGKYGQTLQSRLSDEAWREVSQVFVGKERMVGWRKFYVVITAIHGPN